MAETPKNIEPINAPFEAVVENLVRPPQSPASSEATKDPRPSSEFEVVDYSASDDVEPIGFRLDPDTESIWATQAQIAELFATDRSNVTKHLSNIFSEGELDEEGNVQKLHIAQSSKPVAIYSIDAVISVGYRVNSKAATKFRQWATRTITAFIEQGYVINEKVLRESPEKLNELASKLRALRAEEKQVYAKVRECFKISSSDYDPSAKTVKTFFALLQDKFHHAVTGQTGSKLIMDRADHREDHMGVVHFKGDEPTLKEATTGKNYLRSDELYRLHLLSEQFLLYAESTALAGRKMTMKSLHEQLDRLLQLNDYPVFEGWKDYLRDEAERHARAEMTLYKKRKKIESLGIEYDEEALAAGEYDDLLIEG
ncbi:MAG: hypothetical protein CMF68_11665 [Magnetovibrio sp.]|nr:hypothetical protein [Magnetovibrio sp.]|tara:strand:- start:1326 stop:2435 length:1110 start_codon:yes stop_codon:yes gene_type:complete